MSNLAYKYEDDVKYEILDGQRVAMSPSPGYRHNEVYRNILTIFGVYLKGKPCKVYGDNFDVILDDMNTVKPDILIVCDKNKITMKNIIGAPDLAVEILSYSTTKRDKGFKFKLYEKHGVKEYWIVDSVNHSIEVYLLTDGKYNLDNIYTLHGESEIEEMTDEEKAMIEYEFKTSLFDDLIIKLEDIFDF
jgi:Uma2 family endonuclease